VEARPAALVEYVPPEAVPGTDCLTAPLLDLGTVYEVSIPVGMGQQWMKWPVVATHTYHVRITNFTGDTIHFFLTSGIDCMLQGFAGDWDDNGCVDFTATFTGIMVLHYAEEIITEGSFHVIGASGVC